MEPSGHRPQLMGLGQRLDPQHGHALLHVGGTVCGSEPIGEVAEPRQHMCPSVAGVGHEVLEQGHGGRLALGGIFRPAGQSRYVNETGAVREEAQHLEVRVDAGLRPSNGLEDQSPLEKDRGIALLARVGHPRHAVQPVPCGVIPRPHRRAAKAPAGRREGAPRLDRVEQTRPEARVPVRVEDSEAAERADRPRRVGRRLAERDRDEVTSLVSADQQQDEGRILAERGPVFDAHRPEAAGLAREPALPLDEGAERRRTCLREMSDDRGRVRAECARCHRRAGRTAVAGAGTSSSRRVPG